MNAPLESFDDPRVATMVAESATMAAPGGAKPWTDLSPEQEEAFRWLLPAPETGFSDVQRYFINLWWLPVDAPTLAGLNAACPPGRGIGGRDDGSGGLWICADLLSDALDGGPLGALLPTLETLPLTYCPAEVWPVTEPEEE